MQDSTYKFTDFDTFKAHSFFCMGGLCEVLVETRNSDLSLKIFHSVYAEAKRLESKYSRYRDDNIVYKINNSNSKKIKIDKETYRLLVFADSLFQASNGLFDITSGVLRRAWTFDGSENLPKKQDVAQLLKKVGWKQVQFDKKWLRLPPDWELDFGGIGKEYAVDACCEAAKALQAAPTLVNLGGDIAVTGTKTSGLPWKIEVDQSEEKLLLLQGAVATSGDKNRFLLDGGKRPSHILNPKTGWPIEGAPKSVTVAADSCTEAGALATLSLLHGEKAEKFLADEAENYKIIF